jgi:hypothetical protein
MVEVDNLDANLYSYFKLFFVMAYMGDLDTNLEGYFKL